MQNPASECVLRQLFVFYSPLCIWLLLIPQIQICLEIYRNFRSQTIFFRNIENVLYFIFSSYARIFNSLGVGERAHLTTHAMKPLNSPIQTQSFSNFFISETRVKPSCFVTYQVQSVAKNVLPFLPAKVFLHCMSYCYYCHRPSLALSGLSFRPTLTYPLPRANSLSLHAMDT